MLRFTFSNTLTQHTVGVTSPLTYWGVIDGSIGNHD